MSDDAMTRHGRGKHEGEAHASPYPVQRLSVPHELVDVARQIAEADQVIATVANAKLQVIAEQIRSLQRQAQEIVDEAQASAALHRAECRFRRRVGGIYYLYARTDESLYFSLLAPEDWGGQPPNAFRGAYRLEPDMSWTPLQP